jgi:hypothetical protein
MLAESNPIPGPSQLIEKTEDGAIRAGGRDFHVIGRVFSHLLSQFSSELHFKE